MPYIKDRSSMDEIVNLMIKKNVKADGDLNYVLYTFAKRHIKPSYNNYKNYLGELSECIAEIRRRILSEYEDIKIAENGDIE